MLERKSGVSRSPVNILGINVDRLDMSQVAARVGDFVESSLPHRALAINAHYLNLALESQDVLQIFQRSPLVYADGMSIVWASRILGAAIPQKSTTTDLIHPLCRLAVERNYRLFLLGGPHGLAGAAGAKLVATYAGLQIAGTHHGYFPDHDDENVVREVRKAGADILLVGLGCPLQERWIFRNLERTCAKVAINAGNLFAFLSGEELRGPKWVTDNGFEWAFRLLVEPRKLWRRYTIGNLKFSCRLAGWILSSWFRSRN